MKRCTAITLSCAVRICERFVFFKKQSVENRYERIERDDESATYIAFELIVESTKLCDASESVVLLSSPTVLARNFEKQNKQIMSFRSLVFRLSEEKNVRYVFVVQLHNDKQCFFI